MEQSAMEIFKVIGHCSKMQTVSLDQETKLWDGIPYEINFYQDFSSVYLDGLWVSDMPVSKIIEAILSWPEEISERSAARYPSWEDRQKSKRFWEEVARYEKKERKREKKWRRNHPKLTKKQAIWKYERATEDILGE